MDCVHLAKHTWPWHRRFWHMIDRWWLIVDILLNPFKLIVLLITFHIIINRKPVWYTVTFNTWLPYICTCLMIWPAKLFPDQCYIWRNFLILSGQVSSDASTLKENILCLYLYWYLNVGMEMNIHRNKYFTELILVGNNKYEKFPWYHSIHKSIC